MNTLEKQSINIPIETLESNKINGRCSGHCCAAFTLPFSKSEIKRIIKFKKEVVSKGLLKFYIVSKKEYEDAYELIVKQTNGWKTHNDVSYNFYRKYDIKYFENLLEMLINLNKKDFNYKNPNGDAKMISGCKLYTCKHLNKENGNCMNYENRPDFCKRFPKDRDCKYEGCTCKM